MTVYSKLNKYPHYLLFCDFNQFAEYIFSQWLTVQGFISSNALCATTKNCSSKRCSYLVSTYPISKFLLHTIQYIIFGNLFLCQLTCQSADIMSSLCGVGVRVGVRVNNFSSKTTRPRDVLFFLKDTLSIEDEKLFKACKSVCSSVC